MKYLIFIGTARDSTPPNPPRLGLRVARACKNILDTSGAELTAELIDPLDFNVSGVFKPHFAYGKASICIVPLRNCTGGPVRLLTSVSKLLRIRLPKRLPVIRHKEMHLLASLLRKRQNNTHNYLHAKR